MDPFSNMPFLQNMLQFSTSLQQQQQPGQEDQSNNQSTREISPEKRQFLEEALKSRSVNPNEEMKKCIDCLKNQNETEERRLEALETLRDWCEDINFSIDYHKMNGYGLLFDLMNDKNEEVRALACDFVGTLAQNNEYCQESLLRMEIMKPLLEKLCNDDDKNVKIKALYAISCLIREYPKGLEMFLTYNGVQALVNTIKIPNEKIKLKCCFLISAVCKNQQIKSELTKKMIIPELIQIYREQFELNIYDHILAAITELINNNPDAIKQAQAMNLNFKALLTDRLSQINNDPSRQEERDNAQYLMNTLFVEN